MVETNDSVRNYWALIKRAAWCVTAIAVFSVLAAVPVHAQDPAGESDGDLALVPSSAEEQYDGYSRKDPALAGILSAFLPGGGQFYNGQAGKGLLMLGGTAAAVTVALTAGLDTDDDDFYSGGTGLNGAFWAGLGVAAAIQIWSILDAVGSAERYNEEHGLSLLPELLENRELRLVAEPGLEGGEVAVRAGLTLTF